ncbi:MAG: hypothetical protein COB20_15525 [SAR86 cluster bacterium]|uniref:Uncharacterized protein n=1 Tax=SAR86 cluster bacterium TaxID=2030880 RepID=A0A2A4WW80_9GAMM|nr:MAG: hypothetical protein COB20_15525 [SAR86 cluster bacterium]
MSQSIFKQFWAFGRCIALGFALFLASVFSTWSWIENPGGIFRDSASTNWRFVYDTATSWFIPTFLYTLVLASLLHLLVGRLHSLFNGNKDC